MSKGVRIAAGVTLAVGAAVVLFVACALGGGGEPAQEVGSAPVAASSPGAAASGDLALAAPPSMPASRTDAVPVGAPPGAVATPAPVTAPAGRRTPWGMGRGAAEAPHAGVGLPHTVTGRPHAGGGFGRPGGGQATPITRLLTASMVPDSDEREAYLGFLGRQTSLAELVPLDTTRRVRVQVVDASGRAVNDAHVRVTDGERAVEGRTHADGGWDFFPGLGALAHASRARVEISTGNAQAMREVALPAMGDTETVRVALDGFTARGPRKLELVFLVDVTGSMEDELRYVNDEIGGIVERVRTSIDGVDVRVGATFYRDRDDAAPIERIAMTTDVHAFAAHMRAIQADGGGDYPEDMSKGLASVFEQQRWASDAVRVVVLIADAPPQRYGADFDFVDAARVAAAQGVRILPVSASGSDREVEYLMRALGTITSTPFVQLTDDSGIGSAHLAADAPAQRTELFSDLLTRLLVSDLRGQGMHAAGWQGSRS